MGDGRVDNITSQRGVLGDDDRIAGLRVDTKKENGLDAPGLMASGFNHVLTRLSGVYNVPDRDETEAKSDAENENTREEYVADKNEEKEQEGSTRFLRA